MTIAWHGASLILYFVFLYDYSVSQNSRSKFDHFSVQFALKIKSDLPNKLRKSVDTLVGSLATVFGS